MESLEIEDLQQMLSYVFVRNHLPLSTYECQFQHQKYQNDGRNILESDTSIQPFELSQPEYYEGAGRMLNSNIEETNVGKQYESARVLRKSNESDIEMSIDSRPSCRQSDVKISLASTSCALPRRGLLAAPGI